MENSKLKTVVLHTYTSLAEAQYDLDLLRSQNLACSLNDSNIVRLMPMFSSPFGGIKLVVFEKDIEEANTILKEVHEATDKDKEGPSKEEET